MGFGKGMRKRGKQRVGCVEIGAVKDGICRSKDKYRGYGAECVKAQVDHFST